MKRHVESIGRWRWHLLPTLAKPLEHIICEPLAFGPKSFLNFA